jgi:DNA-binding CsgD family transcriptional regulator
MNYPTTPIELTIREKQILALYAQGIKQQAIADMLGISRFTVVNTLDRAQARLYLKDRWALRDYAKQHGLDKVEQEAGA